MSELVLTGLISGSFGLIGVVTGSLLTLFIEIGRERRQKALEKQRMVIQELESIRNDASSVLFVFQAIDDFIKADFSEPTGGPMTIKAIAQIASLALPDMNNCWNNLRKKIYLFFPKTLSNRYFQYFDSFLGDVNQLTKTLLAKEGVDSMQEFLSENFRNDFVKAKYLLIIFDEELKAIMSGSNHVLSSESRAFYKQNKRQIER